MLEMTALLFMLISVDMGRILLAPRLDALGRPSTGLT
jgi:hypothetical protein